MSLSKEQILERLRQVKGPDLQGNIVDLGLVSEILLKDGRVSFSITVPPQRASELDPLRQAAEKVVREMPGVAERRRRADGGARRRQAATAQAAGRAGPGERQGAAGTRAQGGMGAPPPAPAPMAPAAGGAQRQTIQVPGIKHMIAVASGKGGVGKSTTAVNLALGLQAIGLKVGILDADIYGPSQPRLLGLERPAAGRRRQDSCGPWRPTASRPCRWASWSTRARPSSGAGRWWSRRSRRCCATSTWGDLDVLVIDMPPGTGDVQLTMAQQVPLSGAIIVSTPQDLALIDARKGLAMFRKVDVPVLGIIENMSTFICPKCGERSDIFGHGGAEREAEKLGIPFLGGVPLDMEIRIRSDEGRPIVATSPDGPHARIYRDIAAKAWEVLQGGADARVKPPTLTLSRRQERAARGLRGRQAVHPLGRDAARDEPVGGGAGPLAGAARDGGEEAQRQDQGAHARSATTPCASPSTTATTRGSSPGPTCRRCTPSATSAGRSISPRWR